MRERNPNIHVIVARSVEPIDFDLWCERYVAALLAADRAAKQQSEAA